MCTAKVHELLKYAIRIFLICPSLSSKRLLDCVFLLAMKTLNFWALKRLAPEFERFATIDVIYQYIIKTYHSKTVDNY